MELGPVGLVGEGETSEVEPAYSAEQSGGDEQFTRIVRGSPMKAKPISSLTGAPTHSSWTEAGTASIPNRSRNKVTIKATKSDWTN